MIELKEVRADRTRIYTLATWDYREGKKFAKMFKAESIKPVNGKIEVSFRPS